MKRGSLYRECRARPEPPAVGSESHHRGVPEAALRPNGRAGTQEGRGARGEKRDQGPAGWKGTRGSGTRRGGVLGSGSLLLPQKARGDVSGAPPAALQTDVRADTRPGPRGTR